MRAGRAALRERRPRGDCCSHCGCQCEPTKVCRLVPDTKKVTKIEYECECEDFCVPGKSTRCVSCDECGKRKIVYTPTCGEVRTRTKLVKKEKVTKVPICKCVVEDLCPSCAKQCSASEAIPPTAARPSGSNWQGEPEQPAPSSRSSNSRGEPAPAYTASHQQIPAETAQANAAPASEAGTDDGKPSLLRRALAPWITRQ